MLAVQRCVIWTFKITLREVVRSFNAKRLLAIDCKAAHDDHELLANISHAVTMSRSSLESTLMPFGKMCMVVQGYSECPSNTTTTFILNMHACHTQITDQVSDFTEAVWSTHSRYSACCCDFRQNL